MCAHPAEPTGAYAAAPPVEEEPAVDLNLTREDGFRRLTDADVGEYAQAVIAERLQSPGGPVAPLRPSTE